MIDNYPNYNFLLNISKQTRDKGHSEYSVSHFCATYIAFLILSLLSLII